MHRTVELCLIEWSRSDKLPLIMEGIGQCGKTHTILEFGKKCFGNTVHVDFKMEPNVSKIFDRDLCPERIVRELSAIYGKKINGNTLLFFDNIQFCGNALTSLKYFNEDAPEYNVVCARSLPYVGSERPSFPVGKVSFLRMGPMDFREFLIAEGEEMLIELLEGLKVTDSVPPAFTDRLEKFYLDYLEVGGMPEAVGSWIKFHDMAKVRKIHMSIISEYRKNFGRYARCPETVARIWESIPSQLMRENRKFMFGHVRAGARLKDLEPALFWLIESEYAVKVPLTTDPMTPSANKCRAAFKLYLPDVGLLNHVLRTMLESDESIELKSHIDAVVENYVLCELRNILRADIYCWRSPNTAEVEFVIDLDGTSVPIEVKADRSVKSRSLGIYIEKYSPEKAVKLSPNKMGFENGTYSIPLYMVWNLPKLLKK